MADTLTISTVTNGSDHEIAAYAGVNYDYLNGGQLIQATSGTKVYTMAYDALGRCVKRTLNGAVTYYVYDGEKPILEYKANGTLNGWNIYGKGIDEILMRGYFSGSTWVWYYYQQDHEGSVTHLTDGYGAVIEKYKYDAFGEPIIYNAAGTVITNSAYNNRFLFTGREWAPKNLGFYEYRARAYHPGLGRFMSEDPKGFDAGDYNLYRYCDDDPINKTDPMGLWGTPPEQSYSGAVEINSGYSDGITGTNGARMAASGSDLAKQYGPPSERMSGTASGGIHDPVIGGKHYEGSSNYHKLGEHAAVRAEEQLQANPEGHEYRGYISQKNDGSRDFIALPSEPQKYGSTKIGPKNYSEIYNKNDPRQRDPSPSGYHTVAAVVGQKLYRRGVSTFDQSQLHKAGLDGFISVPSPPGRMDPIRVWFHNEHAVDP